MKELICITCPKGCHLKVDENNDYAVSGNGCPRGAEYGKKECTHPTRVITSTIKICGSNQSRVSVKTSCDVDKSLIFPIMQRLNECEVMAPVHRGDIVEKDISTSQLVFTLTLD
jgi:CxxC motif-containing protein